LKRPNIIILTIECLRKEKMGPFSRGMERVTPVMSELGKRSMLMDRYHSPSSWTLPSFFTIFTSRYSLENNGRIDLNGKERTMVETLKENGYHTLGLTGGGWLSRFFGFGRGFDRFEDGKTESNPLVKKLKKFALLNDKLKKPAIYLHFLKEHYFPGARIGDTQTIIAKRWISERSKEDPFFLWIHYIETHDPYFPNRRMTDIGFNRIWRLNQKIKENMATRGPGEIELSENELGLLWKVYEIELNYIDERIGELVEHLEREGCLNEDTYIMIFGDHGQQFMEHGDFGHSVELYQELVNTPMMIYNRGFKGSNSGALISGLDIAPTILNIAGIRIPACYLGKPFLGKDVIPNDEIVLMEGQDRRDDFILKDNTVSLNKDKYKIAVIKNHYKLIYRSNGHHSMYDLERDASEEDDIFDPLDPIAVELISKAESVIDSIKSNDKREKLRNIIRSIKLH